MLKKLIALAIAAAFAGTALAAADMTAPPSARKVSTAHHAKTAKHRQHHVQHHHHQHIVSAR